VPLNISLICASSSSAVTFSSSSANPLSHSLSSKSKKTKKILI
ncbi:unnamed protein product, partial [Rotaria sp. Silwood1]